MPDLNNQSQISTGLSILTICHHQKHQTFTSVTVAQSDEKTHHIHYRHATLTAHKTHCYNWLHCTLFPPWAGQPANAKTKLCSNWKKSKLWSCLSDNQAWQMISKHRKEVKTWGLFQSVGREIRDELEKKRRGETKTLFIIARFGRLRLMAHLQMTTHTPSPSHKQTEKVQLWSKICCFTATAVRTTTMSLPQPAEKRNPRAWETRGRVASVCVGLFDNEE